MEEYHKNIFIWSENHYSSGALKSKGNWFNGKREGCWEYYHHNGKTWYKGNYSKGNQIGRWKEYNTNGKLIEEEYYVSNN